MSTPLIIAAHGTRDAEGEAVCRSLAERVAGMLPDAKVALGFVELSEPSIPEALTEVLTDGPGHRAVVVPLMLGTGGHVRSDIPEFIAEALQHVPAARIDYAGHLGADPRLVSVVRDRIAAALGDWDPARTTLVFVGRGALVPDANADHVRLARMHYEEGGWADVEAAFIQVTRPSLPEALDRAYAAGARQLVVMGHWLFPGRLRQWTIEQSEAWADAHPYAQVRVAEVIGDCDELAEVVVDRYRETLPDASPSGSPAYLTGLLLDDRSVVVVGAGRVSARRVPRLLDSGAKVTLIAPEATGGLRRLAEDGALEWLPRPYQEGDLDGAWYALASTDDPEVNARVAADAEAEHTFCVRADDARRGSAWTAASHSAGGVSVAVIGNREPRRSRTVRDAIFASQSVRQAIFSALTEG
ncbi:sirohydrochlorin cobaltochelatase [Tessaracoccus bendigoensis DSM 12906]|uniref:precorrin-2 dehydrogenase n=1 Tax=Tessaracoccus bendigoensis DSM 12906 TaxID=1123357 RepID=A0A1M6LBR5_9ACTN|nr:CbiX/SirB N-terminal domain-containing protein [Tessaracoccus bendigoensis]SHJ68582.1 sirohydrochlorin cobaltochelatase [Tessaracoccus bendigoensis DSM 12906]